MSATVRAGSATAGRPVRVAAVDLGASSGRVMVGEVGPGTLALHSVNRFVNEPVRLPSGLHWNLTELYLRVLEGLREAAAESSDEGRLASVGIDSWAVDYGLIGDGRLLGLPFHYRDERRSTAGPSAVHDVVGRAELYARNGLQYLPFNTLYQLAADPIAARAESLALIPDLFGWFLTGEVVAERTNASTTGLVGCRTREWDLALVDRLGLRRRLCAPLVDPGHRVGTITADIGAPGLALTTVGSHDTASAVVGVPMQSDSAAYISCGTWGLVGLELDAPILTDAARDANFTNEGGVDRTVRFLTNVMGTWLISETLRTWEARREPEDLVDLLRAAAGVDAADAVEFDVQDARFAPPGDMEERIRAWCAEHDLAPPASRPALLRSILESLAGAFAHAVEQACALSGREVTVVHMVGGGSQNALLCQLVANRCGRTVLAGPVEATALGNVLVQARAVGGIDGSLRDLRSLVARTHAPVPYHPRQA